MTDAKRIVQLDGLRAIAVFMVFCSHSFGFPLLWAGVDLFFVLSGFLITGILLEQRRQKTWSSYLALFYQRRIKRILPPYLLFLGLTSILFGIGWMHHWYLFVFLMNTASFKELSYRYSLAVLWSLAVEEQFYILWPFAVYWLSETALAWLAGALVLVAPLLRWGATIFFPGHWPIHTSTPFRMDLLAIGALIALAWRHYRTALEQLSAYGLLLTAISVCCLLLFSRYPWFQPGANTVSANVWLYELSLLGCAGAVLWALGGRGIGMLKLTPLVYLGRISYSFYLVHFTVISVIRNHLHHVLLARALAFAVSFIYAALSWRLLERPTLYGACQSSQSNGGKGKGIGAGRPAGRARESLFR